MATYTVQATTISGQRVAVIDENSAGVLAARLPSTIADGATVTLRDDADYEGSAIDLITPTGTTMCRLDIYARSLPREHISDTLDRLGISEENLLP